MMTLFTRLTKTAALALGGTLLYQTAWGFSQIANRNVHQTLATHRNQAKPGILFDHTRETDHYTRRHWLEDGIERIVYTPK